MKYFLRKVLNVILLLTISLFLASCIKNENRVEGDAKIKFFNAVVNSKPQDFYLNGLLNMSNGVSAQSTSNISSGTSTGYIVVAGNVKYNIGVNNYKLLQSHTTGQFSPAIADVFSAFYTKTKTGDSTLFIYKEDVKIDTSQSKLIFINLGYTLKSKVIIRDSLNTINKTLDYGEKSEYFYRKFNGKNKIYVNLVDSMNVVDTIKATNFYKGKVYTILFNGSTIGKLNNRVITNN